MTSEAPAGSRATRPFRISKDIGQKLDDLLDYLDANSADYLDPLLRAQIEEDHKKHKKGIEARRRAKVDLITHRANGDSSEVGQEE